MGQILTATKEILTIDITAHLGLVDKELISLDQAADIISEQIKLHPSYSDGDAELQNIVHNLQSLPEDIHEKQADFYATIEWLKDWGDHGDRLLIID